MKKVYPNKKDAKRFEKVFFKYGIKFFQDKKGKYFKTGELIVQR